MMPELETVEEIFHAALAGDPEQLSAFLDERCAGDEALRGKVEQLLAAHGQADGFIETRIATFASSILTDADDTDLLIGQRIGHYKVLQRISAGGMGTVYLAERADEQYEKQVAIKLIKRGMDTDSVLRHFRNERQILAGFDHPNIARLLDGGATESGLPYFVMEYVEGMPIDRYCEDHRLSIAERLKLFREACAAVTYAHRHTVIHRDIKPSNILVTKDGVPKLLDFGIAKILQPGDGAEALATITGFRLMTPEYASPEQVRGEPVSAATDVYSLGVVLYQLLTGQKPYRLKTRTPEEISRAIVEQEPPRPSTAVAANDGSSKSQAPNPKLLRGDLDNIVLLALRKEPERRYPSVEQFSEDIRRHLEAQPVVARKDTLAYRTAKFIRRNSTLTAVATACLLLALAVVWLLREQFIAAPKSSPPEKSIAVLPFQNLSKEPESAYFAAGVQEEILSSLAKIADLKVISRTSVMQYEDTTKRNLREIGQQLGVAHVLEGSVQRIENRVRIHAQLIDARTDAHLWAQTYDRGAAHLFAIQSEIANAIAAQLRAKISSAEHRRIEQPPTSDLVANDLYRRAIALGQEQRQPQSEPEALNQAVSLLEQAVARDPRFLRVYCALGEMHLEFYYNGHDHTPARLKMADEAIQKATQLQPDAGEVHLIKARYLSGFGIRDYDRAREELELARRTLPNDPAVYLEAALMDRRQGRWTEGLRNFERALESDPNNVALLEDAAATCVAMRRYAEAAQFCRRVIAIAPRNYWARIIAAQQPFYEHADIRPLRKELNAILAEEPNAESKITFYLWYCAVLERDPAAADRALAVFPAQGINDRPELVRPREWFVGYAARTLNRPEVATAAFIATRDILEKLVRDQPNNASAWSLLGRVQAALGQKEEAIKAGRRACELLPLSREPTSGLQPLMELAKIYAWAGENDLALQALQQLASYGGRIGGFNYGEFRLDPDWDPLRGDPGFEEIVVSLAPKETANP